MKQFGIGQPIRRVEDRRFLTGFGRYLDDIARPHEARAAVLRSPYAHARIRALDTSAAAAMPGVVAALAIARGRTTRPAAVIALQGAVVVADIPDAAAHIRQ